MPPFVAKIGFVTGFKIEEGMPLRGFSLESQVGPHMEGLTLMWAIGCLIFLACVKFGSSANDTLSRV